MGYTKIARKTTSFPRHEVLGKNSKVPWETKRYGIEYKLTFWKFSRSRYEGGVRGEDEGKKKKVVRD